MRSLIKVAAVVCQPVYRLGLCLVLSSTPGVEIVESSSERKEAVQIVRHHHPHIMILDGSAPGEDEALIEAVLREDRSCRTVLLGNFGSEERMRNLRSAGVCGFAPRNVPPNMLVELIKAVHLGELRIVDMINDVTTDAENGLEESERRMVQSLTERERDVLRMLTLGLPNREIAERFGISERTVKYHLGHVLQKLHLRNRVEAAVSGRRLLGDARSGDPQSTRPV